MNLISGACLYRHVVLYRLLALQGGATSHEPRLYLDLFLQSNKQVKQGKNNEEHGVISGLVRRYLLSLSIDWWGLIGIRIATIFKNAFRSISREPSTSRQNVSRLFLYIIKFPIFFVNNFFRNINIVKVITFTMISLRISH